MKEPILQAPRSEAMHSNWIETAKRDPLIPKDIEERRAGLRKRLVREHLLQMLGHLHGDLESSPLCNQCAVGGAA